MDRGGYECLHAKSEPAHKNYRGLGVDMSVKMLSVNLLTIFIGG